MACSEPILSTGLEMDSASGSQLEYTLPPFLQLPQDLVEEILRHLDYISLFRCSVACRLLHGMVETSSEFQYFLELGRQALIDTSASDTCYSTRLRNLRRQRVAWSTLSWRKQFEVKMNIKLEAYEMVAGFFSCIDSAGNFQVAQLPTSEDEIPPEIHKTRLGIRPQDFTFDPAQDLVVFFVSAEGPLSRTEGRDVVIHLRTVSSNVPHPEAQVPLLCFFIPPSDAWANGVQASNMQLVDDILAVFYSTGAGWLAPRLLIWNWKTGDLLTDSHLHPLPRHTGGFSLIAPYAFVLTCIDDDGSIEVFTFSRTSLAPPIRIVSLSLPRRNSKANLGTISMHSGPLGSSSNLRPHPNNILHVISPEYIAGSRFSLYSFSIFILNHTLLSFISRHQTGTRFTADPIPWDEWSNNSTRIMPNLTPNSWLRYVYGQRIVFPPFGGGLSTQTLRILDFNVHRNREETIDSYSTRARNSPSENGTRTLRSDVSVVSDDVVFKRRIMSRLPCYSIDT